MDDVVLFSALALGHLLLLLYALRDAGRDGWLTPASGPILVLAGLVYDNTVLAAGSAIGEGALLGHLSLARFWIHALVTPGLVLFAWHVAARASLDGGRAAWLRGRLAAGAAAAVTLGLVALELVTVVGLELGVRREHGVLAYADTESGGGPPVMVLVVALALVLAGVSAGRWQGWWWLLAGALVMTVGSTLPAPSWSGAVTNVLELVLLASVVATRHRQGDSHPDRRAQ